ncbi:MAG: nickel/cobalt transporter [Alphaproteobacteria bacterium]|nr:nickel/cobalt transporter [Alphaproteobacteria bacterium]
MQLADMIEVIQNGQRVFHETIIDDLNVIKASGSIITTFSLMLVGFLYGAFHAVGPGHGKVIVSGYMLANEKSLKRGLVIVALSSLMQALVAIMLVLSFFYVLNLARAEVERATNLLETASYALVGLLGIGLMLRGFREFFPAKKNHGHEHHHHHGEDCCGHHHVPNATEITKAKDLGAILVMIASIGIRPCSGAVLLLFFSCIVGAVWPGILATFAMAAGTALTTGILAVLTVKSKNLALGFLKTTDKGIKMAHAGLSLCGGLAVVLLSGFFLIATMNTPTTAPLPTKLPLMHLPNAR